MEQEEFEVTIEKHPLEKLVEKIAADVSILFPQYHFIGMQTDESIFSVSIFLGETFFRRRKIYGPVLIVEEETYGKIKKITAYPFNEEIGALVKNYRDKYLAENSDVSYFTLLRNPTSFVRNKRGFC